ncbi:glycosyltransferase [Lachnospiraceae bacterium LCP25S3_G4]
MKVLFINSDSWFGSTGRIVWDLYEFLSELGHEVVIGYGREGIKDNKSHIKIGTKLDVYVHALKTRIFDAQGLASKYATKVFIKKIKAFQPDIIHLHNIHGSYINIELLFKYIKESKIPVVWTLHDCWGFTGHCAHYTYVGCRKWKTGCEKCPQKKCYPASKVMDRSRQNYKRKKELFNGVDNLTVVTVSTWLQEEVKQSFLNKYDIRTISNGIDLTLFKPTNGNFRSSYHIEDKVILLGVSSCWSDRKGLWLFIELSKILDESYQIVLVGVTKEQKKKLPANIIAIERTNSLEKLIEIYTAANIFINASIEETFGFVTLEALACGTQVITNKYTSNPLIVNHTSGYVVNEIQVEDYYEGIQSLSVYPKDSQKCREQAEKFCKEKTCDEYLKLYKEVILSKYCG